MEERGTLDGVVVVVEGLAFRWLLDSEFGIWEFGAF